MRGMTSMRWLAVGIAAVIVGGCKCGTDPDADVCGIVVTFDSPKDNDDVGTTLDVTITATRDGGAVQIDSANLAAKLTSSGAEFGPGRTGTISGNRVTFSGVTLEAGENLIRAMVQTPGVGTKSECVEQRTITVTAMNMMTGDPDVTSFTFMGDANNDKVINQAEFNASNMQVTAVVATSNAIGCSLSIVDQGEVTRVFAAPVAVSGSTTSRQLNLPNTTDASYNLQALLTDCPGGRLHNVAADVEAKSTLRIDTQAPTCALLAPAKDVLGPNDDASLSADFQLRALGTATGAMSMELRLMGGGLNSATGFVSPDVNGELSHDFTVPATGTVSYLIAAEARDAAGNACSASRSVQVKYDPPVVVITSPTAANSPYNMLTIPLIATVTGGEGGTVRFQTGSRDLGTFTVVNGAVSGSGAFQPGQQTVTAIATDLAGNSSAPATQLITVTQPVGTCTLLFTRPGNKPALITAADLVGGMYTVQAQSSCTNEPVTFRIDGGGSGLVANTNAMGVASWTVPLTAGGYVFRVEVGSGSTANFDEVNVLVDTSVPTITQPFSSTPPVVLNVAQDTNRAVPGVVRLLRFNATVPVGGRVDVCSDQTPAPPSAIACPDGAAGWWVLKTGAVDPEPTFTFPDGTYSIKVVVVSGATRNVSAPVALFVDSIRPVVTNVALPQDTNADRKLNIAELNGMAPQITFTLGAADTSATISSVVVRAQVGGTSFTSANAVTITGSQATVNLDQNVTATEADYDWFIVVTDRAGNSNVVSGGTPNDPLNMPAVVPGFRIDKVAPTCTLTAPSKLLLGIADDAAPGVSGHQLRARATTSMDVPNVGFSLTGAMMMTAATAGGAAEVDFTVNEGTYDIGASCTDASGNATAAPPITGVAVDLTAPTCSIAAPAAGSYSSFNIVTTVNVGGTDVAGRPVTVRSTLSGGPIGSLTVSGMSASGTLGYPGGAQTITAEVSDPAGNLCTAMGVMIDVTAMGCAINFVFPVPGVSGKAFINRASDTNPATPTTAEFVATGQSSNCTSGTVTLQDVTSGAPITLGTGTLSASGAVGISASLSERPAPYTLRLQVDDGAGHITQTDLTNVFVDLTNPAVAAVTPTGSDLKFVAATNPGVGSAGFVQDATPGGDADFTVTATNITGAVGGVLRVLYAGAPVASQSITAEGQSVAALPVTIGHKTTGTFVIEVSDEAGNIVRPTNTTATVDVIPPAAPSVSQMVSDPRSATVSLQWSPTYDDGTNAASGPHDGYDIRWTTSSVTLGNSLATEADYFDSTKANREMLVPHSASQITRTYDVPPVNTYFIAVRAKDAIGNYSPYTAPSALPNPGSQVTFTNPTAVAGQAFGNVLNANGSIDGDAFDDLVVGAESANRVYVFFGGPALGSQTSCPVPPTATSPCQDIALPGTAMSDNFGTEIAVGNIGESAASDIIVSSRGYSSSTGRAFIFFGGSRPIDVANFVEIRGQVSNADFGRAFLLPDLDGDGLGEIALSAPLEGAGFRGRVYIFKGRSRAQFDALRDVGDTFVKSSKADWIIEGPTSPPSIGNSFGLRRGFASLGAFTADGGVAFTVPATTDNVNKLFVFSAADVVASSSATPLTTGDNGTAMTPPNQAIVTLRDTNLGSGTTSAGFGSRVIGGRNLVGATLNDLVVTNPRDSKVQIFADGTPAGWGAAAQTVTGTSTFGVALGVADFNADGRLDLVATEQTALANAWLLINRSSTFEPLTGRGFWMSRFYTSPSASAVALSVATGDFDGDSKTDFAVGDRLSAPGKVFIWH